MSTDPFSAELLDAETICVRRHGLQTGTLAALRMGVDIYPWTAALDLVAIECNELAVSDVRLSMHVAGAPLRIVGGAACPRARSRKSNERCSEAECQVCNANFYLDTALDADRPPSTTGRIAVYARDLLTLSRTVVVAHPDVLLFYRRPGKHVRLCATTICAPAYVHARHAHAVASAMRIIHSVAVDDLAARPIADRLRAGCTERVFDLEEIGVEHGGPYRRLTAARPERCIGCGRCTPAIDGRRPVAVQPVAHELTFESSITPPQLVLAETATALLQLLREVRTALVVAKLCPS